MNSKIVKLKRLLKLTLPKGQAAFLWGARKTGKSTFLKTSYSTAIYYDLLKSDEFLRLNKHPQLLREEIQALSAEQLLQPVIIDEIQRIPELLNEVHWLLENTDAYFILCGSSARKLKRGAANLLGGRAWRFHFFPLVWAEIPDFELLQALQRGLIPSHYLQANFQRSLKAYVIDYLNEEIQAEGLVRNIPAFSRFLDSLGLSHGELTNYSNIARDCGVSSKTVKEYYQILVDTLLGYYIFPYNKKVSRDLISATPKFYLFDIGIANYLAKYNFVELQGQQAGRAFEQFILLELLAYRGLQDLDFEIHFWRTKTGLEVDFILGQAEIAMEVKISANVRQSDLKGLAAFIEEYQPRKALCICLAPKARKLTLGNQQTITILPWQNFLDILWQHKLFQ